MQNHSTGSQLAPHRNARHWTHFRVAMLVAAAVQVFVLSNAAAEALAQNALNSREYAIKAGVLGVLRKCVTWPPAAAPRNDAPLTIGILGKDPFVENGVNQLDRVVAEDRGKGGQIVVKRFTSVNDYQPCHILFVSNMAADEGKDTLADRLAVAKSLSSGSTVLIVGESAGLARQGASANLVFDRATNVIRLEINPDAAARAGLTLAPDLLRLKLVQIVRDAPG